MQTARLPRSQAPPASPTGVTETMSSLWFIVQNNETANETISRNKGSRRAFKDTVKQLNPSASSLGTTMIAQLRSAFVPGLEGEGVVHTRRDRDNR